MYKAEIVGHSINHRGDEIISVLATFPRFILAEVNTHRMLCKNTSSSRAIPFEKMVEAVKTNPFIPIAWQKHHSGMQGSEYLDSTKEYNLMEFIASLLDTLNRFSDKESSKYKKLKRKIDEKIKIIDTLLQNYKHLKYTLPQWWLLARDKAVETASLLYVFDVTKQLCNRLLEPFMWTTMLLTGSKQGWENFFYLRQPNYYLPEEGSDDTDLWIGHTKGEAIEALNSTLKANYEGSIDALKAFSFAELLEGGFVKGNAEIHIMYLSELILDALNESTPIPLTPGDWHIPFWESIDSDKVYDIESPLSYKDAKLFGDDATDLYVKISTAMAARTSYTLVGEEKEIDYLKMIELHDKLVEQTPPHSSPLEHCAQVPMDDEYCDSFKGQEKGWFRMYKGFKSYRQIIEES